MKVPQGYTLAWNGDHVFRSQYIWRKMMISQGVRGFSRLTGHIDEQSYYFQSLSQVSLLYSNYATCGVFHVTPSQSKVHERLSIICWLCYGWPLSGRPEVRSGP